MAFATGKNVPIHTDSSVARSSDKSRLHFTVHRCNDWQNNKMFQKEASGGFTTDILTNYDFKAILELAFVTKWLRQLCESEAKGKKELGEEIADKLKSRMADLRAASSVVDLVAGRPRETNGNFVIDLTDGVSIIFSANHNTNPLLKNGKVDWSKVRRIKIEEIAHDNEQKL